MINGKSVNELFTQQYVKGKNFFKQESVSNNDFGSVLSKLKIIYRNFIFCVCF